jgi:N-acetylglucosaminyldiphosphoundecaprenol N-acetyl-beta-D-mannosaminyltransferase
MSWTHDAPVHILGVPISPWDRDGLIDSMIGSAAAGHDPDIPRLSTVHYANVHVLNTAYRNRALGEQLRRASTVYCDGSGIRLGAALLGRRLPPRLTAADWIDAFCACAARQRVSLFLVGGAEGVAERAAAILGARQAGLRIAGTHHGFIDDRSSLQVVARVNESVADIVLVGMGTPAQELWVARFRQSIQAPVVWTVGALFDFVTGQQRRAPAWLQRLHMEWLWRLGTAPGRLGGRYVIGNPLFLLRVLMQRSGVSR